VQQEQEELPEAQRAARRGRSQNSGRRARCGQRVRSAQRADSRGDATGRSNEKNKKANAARHDETQNNVAGKGGTGGPPTVSRQLC